MNINDVLQFLPIAIRGRFSSSDNAWWIAQTASCIQRIERLPIGPNRIRRAMAYQLSSGFIPKPKCLATINSAWLDDEPVDGLANKDDRGFQMEKGAVTFDKLNVEVSAEDELTAKVAFFDPPKAGGVDGVRPVTINQFDGPNNDTLYGLLEFTDGLELPAAADLVNCPLWMSGSEFYIKEAFFTGSVLSFRIWEDSSLIIGSPLPDQLIGCPVTDSLVDYEAQIDLDQVVIAASSWNIPVGGVGGFTGARTFTCERAHPGRSWLATRTGILLKSNLVVEGYRSLARPSSMTDELDIPDGSEELIASYLRWKGESNMDPGSDTAIKCEREFESNLQRFSIDQSQTNGESMPHAYNMNITLSRGRF